jgi:methylmalonyl-CoA mutase
MDTWILDARIIDMTAEVSGEVNKFELTDSMRALGIVDLSISNPDDYHDPVVRMYAGSSVPSEANRIYKLLHEQRSGGRTNLSIAFDLVSQNGANPFQEGRADIGKVGTAIYDATDMQQALEGIPLDETSTSMTINGTAAFMLASYIVAGEATGVPPDKLRGTVQNDVLKEHFRNTVSADLDGAFGIACDIVEYCTAQGELPGWFGLSASGYHIAEAGASASREIGITQANAEAVLDEMLVRGHSVEDVAPRFSFFYVTRPDDFIEETAKLRAARIIWANRLHHKYGNDDPSSQKMRMHVHTAGEAMPRQYVEAGTLLAGHSALSAQLAPAQSLHVVGFREALSIPDDRERAIGMFTPQLQQDAVKSLRKIIDGSPRFQQLVYEHIAAAAEVLLEIGQAGGALQALRDGLPQRMVTEDFVEREEDKTNGNIPILGRNIGPKDPLDSSVVSSGSDSLIVEEYLRDLRERLDVRDAKRIAEHIAQIRMLARNGVNVIEPTIDAVRDGITVWEWNEAVREAIGDDVRPILLESESRIMGTISEAVSSVRDEVMKLYPNKQPRILVTKIGLDGHDKGAKVVIKVAEGAGFDVEQGNYRPTPEDVALDAIKKGADLIAVSVLSGSHLEQIAAISNALDDESDPESNIGIIVGGTIPGEDIKELLKMKRVKGVVDSQDDPTLKQIGWEILDASKQVVPPQR